MTQVLIKIGGETIDQSAVTSFPADRRFRNHWTLDGTVIEVDLDGAKEQYKDEVRFNRKSLFEQFDVPIIIYTEKTTFNGDLTQAENDAGDALVIERQKLRDAPDDSRIDAASDIATLDALDVFDVLS